MLNIYIMPIKFDNTTTHFSPHGVHVSFIETAHRKNPTAMAQRLGFILLSLCCLHMTTATSVTSVMVAVL